MNDLRRAFEQVMKAVSVQEKVRVVIDKAIADAEKLIEALAFRADVFMGSQVPLSVESRLVAGIAESFGECNFLKGHERALGGHVPLTPGIHAAPLRMPPGHQGRSGRAADSVGVGGCESHSVPGQAVDVRRVQIARPVAAGIQRPLVIGEEDDDVRLIGRSRGGLCEQNEQNAEAKHRRLRKTIEAGDSELVESGLILSRDLDDQSVSDDNGLRGLAKLPSPRVVGSRLPTLTGLPALWAKVSERRQTGSLTLKEGTHKLPASLRRGCEG